MENKPTYEELCAELNELAHELDPWYNVSKVKWYMVCVCTKDETEDNVFDILSDGVNWYDETHVVPSEVYPIIGKIQAQMKEIDKWFEEAVR